ncbi:hypothetical protein ADL21_33470 [Streptomyces albus subsp. albus]|nr:hypothetical protein ADL21_33470 [Streptomyces albus subsp. albus]
MQLLHGRLYFTLPKGGKTRIADMPQPVASELAEHFAEHPAPSKSSCPGKGPEPEREVKTFPLMLTTTYGNAVRANIFNVEVWKPTLAAAGLGHSSPTITLSHYAHFMPEAGGKGRKSVDV